MTLTAVETAAPVAAPDPDAPASGSGVRTRLTNQLVGSMTTVLAVMLLVFVAEMVVVGPVTHARAQNVLYRDFRSQLANAVAPTGQLDAGGRPVAMGAPVAVMVIPSIGLKEVVAQGTTAGVLRSGPGHRRDSALPGQAGTVVVLGRQATYGGPFGKIARLRPGAEIAFATGQGKALYRVTGIRRAGDPAPTPDPAAGRLTLMTGDGPRFVPSDVVRVDAVLATAKQPSTAGPLSTGSLTVSERPMAWDRSALVPLLLWSQLLLVLAVLLAWVRADWGRWPSWIVSVPVLGFVGFRVAGLVAMLLPNLI